MTDKLKLAIRIIISFVSLVIVFNLVDFDKAAKLARNIQGEVIIITLLFMLLGHIGSGLRFHYIVNALKRKLTYQDALKTSFVALWFNQLLPTGMGGDVVRVIILADKCGRSRIIISALLDRMFGLFWMILIIMLFLPTVLYTQLGPEKSLLILVGCGGFLVLGLLPIWIRPRYCKKLDAAYPKRICRYISLLGHSMCHVLTVKHLYKFIIYLALSFFPYVVYVSLLGTSFGLKLTLMQYIAIVPVIFISMQIPISIGGWGVRELAALYVFTSMGISQEIAVIISILYGMGLLLTSIPGNFLWWQSKQEITNKKSMARQA